MLLDIIVKYNITREFYIDESKNKQLMGRIYKL